MKNMLFVRLEEHLINMPKVLEINLGDEEHHIEVCYNNDNKIEIDPDNLEKGALERFEACILNLRDGNVFFVKLGLHLVNLTHVLGIVFTEKEAEIYYDDGENSIINNKDIETNAFQELNKRLFVI